MIVDRYTGKHFSKKIGKQIGIYSSNNVDR